MNRIKSNDLLLWQFEGLGKESAIRHFISDRGSNTGEKDFTLSFSSSPDREEVQKNRNLLASAMGVDRTRLFFPSQVHKTRIVNVTRLTTTAELMETDALITRERELCIAVMSADCVPILLFDRENNAVGAVHSGWRGTVAKILMRTLMEMQLQFGTRPEHLSVALGPSVSQDSYEVGEEVVHAVRNVFGSENDLLYTQANGKAKLDLWKANVLQLHEFGVATSQIEISGLCTVKNNDHFFSARKGDTGRFAAGILLV